MPIVLIRGMNMKHKSKTAYPKAHITVIKKQVESMSTQQER